MYSITEKPYTAPSAAKIAIKKFGKFLKSAFTPKLSIRQKAEVSLTSRSTAASNSTAPTLSGRKQPRQTAAELKNTLAECGLFL